MYRIHYTEFILSQGARVGAMKNSDQAVESQKTRKSLAVDVHTYDMLQDICNRQRRSKIDQLKVLIEREHQLLFPAEARA